MIPDASGSSFSLFLLLLMSTSAVKVAASTRTSQDEKCSGGIGSSCPDTQTHLVFLVRDDDSWEKGEEDKRKNEMIVFHPTIFQSLCGAEVGREVFSFSLGTINTKEEESVGLNGNGGNERTFFPRQAKLHQAVFHAGLPNEGILHCLNLRAHSPPGNNKSYTFYQNKIHTAGTL